MVKESMRGGMTGYKTLFIDLNMPIMNGMEATRTIRELYESRTESLFIIGVSGDSGAEIEENCKAAGMNMLGMVSLA